MRQKIEKWQRWIERIRDQIQRLMMYRSYNAQYEAIVNKNPNLNAGNEYLQYFRAIYADFATMAIRRQAKGHDDSISLRGLLEDIKANPTVLTRQWLRDFYAEPGRTQIRYPREMSDHLADEAFRQFDDGSGNAMDPAKIDADIAILDKGTEKVVTYADRALAHDDKGGPRLDTPVTFNDVEAAIQTLETVAKKYIALLTGAAYISLTPIDLTGASQVFRQPWLVD